MKQIRISHLNQKSDIDHDITIKKDRVSSQLNQKHKINDRRRNQPRAEKLFDPALRHIKNRFIHRKILHLPPYEVYFADDPLKIPDPPRTGDKFRTNVFRNKVFRSG